MLKTNDEKLTVLAQCEITSKINSYIKQGVEFAIERMKKDGVEFWCEGFCFKLTLTGVTTTVKY